MSSTNEGFTFSDLFAGIGGFHAALHQAGGTWAFASEIDPAAKKVYDHNWLRPLREASAILPSGVSRFEVSDDIVPLTDPVVQVPHADVLAAGFPCQPFSKSGFQRGMEETRGTLFWNIARILQDEERRPSVVILENVRNLAGPRHLETTFKTIVNTLRELGYRTPSKPTIMSPHLVPPEYGGRPQVRERVFILAHYVGREAAEDPANFDDPFVSFRDNQPGWAKNEWNLLRDLPLENDDDVDAKYFLESADLKIIQTWDKLLTEVAATLGPFERLPGFPIWFDDFRSLGDAEEMIEAASLAGSPFPGWKRNFLIRNAEFYDRHRSIVEKYRPLMDSFAPSRRKFEWQAGTHRPLADTIMHFRPSGIRAKQPDYVPALVAITQTSILGDRRRLTPREVARLQGLHDTFEFLQTPDDGGVPVAQRDAASYKQMGNGVNVGTAHYLFSEYVLHHADEIPPHIVEAVRASAPSPDERPMHGASETEQPETDQLSLFDFVEPEDVTSDRVSDGQFVPARDKLEVVNRISRSVGGPAESLGPGSKEHKSVLLSVANRLDVPEATTNLSKPKLAEHLVRALGGTWGNDCWSSGQTLTLVGLNELLRCTEVRFGSGAHGSATTPESEARAILDIVVKHTPVSVDGKSAVRHMLEAQSSDWAKTEWPGFYFEFCNLGPLMASLGGAPATTNNNHCVLDLRAGFVWDLKVHREDVRWTILNDRAATEGVLKDDGGLGLVVLTADMELDTDHSFSDWFKDKRLEEGLKPAKKTRERAYRRALKKSSTARRLDIYYFTAEEWADAVRSGVIRTWAQPPQPGGQPRNPKFQIALDRASDWVVASHEF